MEFEQLIAEVDSFKAKLIEQGATGIAVLVRFPNSLASGGGQFWAGDNMQIYAMCKKYVLQQEAGWVASMRLAECDDEDE